MKTIWFDYFTIVGCHYNAVQHVTKLHTAPRWQWQSFDKNVNSQKTTLLVRFGVPLMKIFEKIDYIKTVS